MLRLNLEGGISLLSFFYLIAITAVLTAIYKYSIL